MVKEKIIIAIDPGTHMGFALYDKRDNGWSYGEFSFWGLIEKINRVSAHAKLGNYRVKALIEYPQLNKAIFVSRLKTSVNKRTSLKIASDVGKNFRDAELIAQYLSHRFGEVDLIRPKNKKVSMEYLQKKAGLKIGSQHTRDAIMLLIDNRYTHIIADEKRSKI